MIKKTNNVVTFEFDENTNEKVYLAGDFNNWNPNLTPLTKVNGKWQVTLTLTPGEHQFRYYARNRWYNDWRADKYVANGLGSENSVVVINTRNTTTTTTTTTKTTNTKRR